MQPNICVCVCVWYSFIIYKSPKFTAPQAPHNSILMAEFNEHIFSLASYFFRKTTAEMLGKTNGEKWGTEDAMVGWHYQLNGHECEQIPGGSEGQRSLACCSSQHHRVRHNLVTEQLLRWPQAKLHWTWRNPFQFCLTHFLIREVELLLLLAPQLTEMEGRWRENNAIDLQ